MNGAETWSPHSSAVLSQTHCLGSEHFPSRRKENISSENSLTPQPGLWELILLVLFNFPELHLTTFIC